MSQPRFAFDGEVTADGKLVLDDRPGFVKAIAAFVGKRVTVVLGRKRKPRSLAENAYMWAVVYQMIALETGHEPQEVHDAMRVRFLLRHSERLGVRPISTTVLSTVEMEEYLEKVRAFAATELGLHIPLPNEPTAQAIMAEYREAA